MKFITFILTMFAVTGCPGVNDESATNNTDGAVATSEDGSIALKHPRKSVKHTGTTVTEVQNNLTNTDAEVTEETPDAAVLAELDASDTTLLPFEPDAAVEEPDASVEIDAGTTVDSGVELTDAAVLPDTDAAVYLTTCEAPEICEQTMAGKLCTLGTGAPTACLAVGYICGNNTTGICTNVPGFGKYCISHCK